MVKFKNCYIVAIFAAMCMTSSSIAAVTVPDGSRAFRDGYVEGCKSGYTDAGRDGAEFDYTKDTSRYSIDAEYHRGWDQGHNACYVDEQAHPRVLGHGDGSN